MIESTSAGGNVVILDVNAETGAAAQRDHRAVAHAGLDFGQFLFAADQRRQPKRQAATSPQAGFGRRGLGHVQHRQGEAVAEAGNGGDGLGAEQLAQHADLHGGERHAVGHVNLDAAAARGGVLVERRLEQRRPEVDPGNVARIQGLGEPLVHHPRRADQFERPRGAAPLRDIRPLEQHGSRIDHSGVQCRHVGGRHHPRQSGVVGVHVSVPSFDAGNLERRSDGEVLVEERCELADRHSVAHRDWKLADE